MSQTRNPSTPRAQKPSAAEQLAPLWSVAATTLLAIAVDRLLPHASLSMLFLTSILLVSARYGFRSGLIASLLSFLVYNFLFTAPQYSLKVDDDGEVVTLIFFLVTAAIGGHLAARIHQAMLNRLETLEHHSAMVTFGQHMATAPDTDRVVQALGETLHNLLKTPVGVFLPAEGGVLSCACMLGDNLEPDIAQVGQVWRQNPLQPVQRGDRLFLPLVSGAGPVGLVVLAGRELSTVDMYQTLAYCNQAAIALDRTLLAVDLHQARLTSEREQLRSALLSSLSHDLRTPLAAVIGSVSSVLDLGAALTEKQRQELLVNALDEGKRLDRYIQNLLDMTRIGQGALTLERGWNDVHDIVAGAAARLGLVPGQAPLVVSIPPDFPLLWVHGALIEQAVVNLLDNACRFTPQGGRITVNVRQAGDRAEIEVIDEGPGIPPEDREKVFEMFHTTGDRHGPHGTGLGLAICRGMVAAHSGTITAGEGPGGRGARMLISLEITHPDADLAPA